MKKTIKIVMLISIFYIALIMNSKVDAASATISATKKEITVGETTTIKVVANAAAWNIHVSGAATLSEADADSSCENVTKTFTVNFKGEKAGTYTFNLSGDVTDGNTDKTSKISGSTQVVVKEKVNSTNTSTPSNNTNNNKVPTTSTVSSDATLKNLGITPNEYDFKGFQKDKTDYTVTVPNNVETIKIYANASSSKASINGIGDKNLNVGENNFSIVVTAENKKTTKQYNIKVIREEKNKIGLGIYKLELIGINENGEEKTIELNKEFEKDTLTYSCNVGKDIEKIKLNAETYDYNDSIKIEGNYEKLEEGTNEVIISVNDENNTITYIIEVNKERNIVENNNEELIDSQQEKTKEKSMLWNNILFIVIGFVSCLLICGIGAIIIFRKMVKQ